MIWRCACRWTQMGWCFVDGTPAWLWRSTAPPSVLTDTTTVRLLHRHRLPHNNQLGSSGLSNKVEPLSLLLLWSFLLLPGRIYVSVLLGLYFFFCMLNVSVFMFLFLKNGKKMTSITAAHPDQHPEGLVLHLDLHPQMTMRRSKSQWQVRSELLDQFYTCWFKVYKWILLQKFNIKICTLLLSLSFFLHLLQ